MLNAILHKFNKYNLRLVGFILIVALLVVFVGPATRDYLQSLRVTTQVYDLNTRAPYQAPSCDDIKLNDVKPALTSSVLATDFSLLVWNVYKYQDPDWQETLTELVQSHDLALLQEASSEAKYSQFWHRRGWQGYGTSAFSQDGNYFGVQNLARVAGRLVCVDLSPEPWLQIPKSTLVTLYPIANAAVGLLAINVHGINFTLGIQEWELQLASLFALVKQHQGPVILAGDFNTWSGLRQHALREQAELAGLSEVSFKPDHRLEVMGEPLDHVYVKGIEVVSAKAHALAGSDHFPMEVVLRGKN